MRKAALALALSLLAGPVVAQAPCPPNTVWGRLAVPAQGGKCVAIPFDILFSNANVQPATANLTALLALSSTGFPTRTGTNTWAQRSVAGTTNEICVTNGNGVSGNPTIGLCSTIAAGGKTFTGNPNFTGNIGVGNASPAARIDVAGTIRAVGTTSLAGQGIASSISIDNSAGTGRVVSTGPDASTKGAFRIIQATSDLATTVTPFAIDASGNVGVGTTSPLAQFQNTGSALLNSSGGTLKTAATGINGASGCIISDGGSPATLTATPCAGGTGLPVGGALGQMVIKYDGTDGHANWYVPGEFNIAADPLADCTGVAASDTAFNNAFSGHNTVLVPSGCTLKLSADHLTQMGTTKTLIMRNGALLSVDTTKTVNIKGDYQAGQYQTFSGAGTVTGIRHNVRPEWWNCDGANDEVCINAANASTVAGASLGSVGARSSILLGCGKTYIINSAAGVHFSPSDTNNLEVIGCGPESTIIQGKGTRSFTRGIVTIDGTANPLWWRLAGVQIKSETINQVAQCLTLAPGGNELHGHGPSILEDFYITNCNVGIGWYRARQLHLHRWSIWAPSFAVTGAADNGSGLIRLVISSTATFTTGQIVQVAGIVGTGALTANSTGSFVITVIDGTHIDLQSSTFAGVYTSGGYLGNGIGIYFDQDVATDVGGDSDIHAGQIVCGGNGADGGVGTGFRVKAEGASTAGGATAFRLHSGVIFYHCWRGIYATTANGANAGDFWILPGVQFEVNGNAITAVATGAFIKTIANWQIRGVYHQSSNGQQAVFKFTGATGEAVFNLQIADVKAQSMGVGTLGRFAEVSGASNVKITGNLISAFPAQGSANDLINFGTTDHAVVANNVVLPDGISAAVPCLVTAGAGTDDLVVVGNSARLAVSATLCSAPTHSATAGNLP